MNKTENSLNEMIQLDKENKKFEEWLQVYFTKNIGRDSKLNSIIGKGNNTNILWIGNEVSCGVGMQKIDVFVITSDKGKNKQFNIIELKCVPAYPEIAQQIERYVDWTTSYIEGAKNSNIQPVIVTREVKRAYSKNGRRPLKVKMDRDKTIDALIKFNGKNISKEVKWFEFNFIGNDINFREVSYKRGENAVTQ